MFSQFFHPPKYISSALLIAIGGLLFGLDTGTIGPLTTMPQFTSSFGQLSSTIHGLVVSTILIPAAISSFFGGHLANSVGRIRGIAIGAFIFGLGASIEASSYALAMLVVGRAVKGVGEGLYLSTCVVYITEISPPRQRGTLASLPQFLTTIGLASGYFICYGSVSLQSSISWRLPYIIQAVISYIYVTTTLLFLPESPRWLAASGKKEESLRIWQELGIEDEDTESDCKDSPSGANVVKEVKWRDLLEVFGKDCWRQTALGVFLMGMQQASGIDGVLYYAPLLFRNAGLTSSTSSFLASGISALLIFLTTIPAVFLLDRFGRRLPTIYGGLLQVLCMLVMGSLFATDSVHATYGIGRWIVVIAIYAYAIVFSGSWGVTLRVYCSEIQPARTRAGASSLGLSANWAVNYIIALTTPIFLAHSTFGVYFFFGGCTLLTVVVCFFFMPETKGRRLEDIEIDFRSKKRVEGNGDVERSGVVMMESSVSEDGVDGKEKEEKESVLVRAREVNV